MQLECNLLYLTSLTQSISRFMLGFFNTETLSREDVIYAVTTGAPLHQPLKQGSTNPHCCQNVLAKKKKSLFCFPIEFPVGKLTLFLPLPWDAQKRTRKSRVHHGLNQSMATAPMEEFTARDTALLLLEGNTGSEERIKEHLMLALYLGELISEKDFLGAHAHQCLCHVLREGHRKSQAPGQSE